MIKTYIVSSLLALGLFSYAQYHGLSLFGSDEAKPQPGETRNVYHK